MSVPSQDNPEYIVANGEQVPVSRRDMHGEIEQCVRERSVDHEEAWEQVKIQLQAFIEGRALPKEWFKERASQKGRVAQDEVLFPSTMSFFPTKAGSIIDTRTTDQPTTEIGGLATIQINEEKRDLQLNLSDDLLPAHLKKSGMPIMDAITKGLVKLKGEHPDAELLRASVAQSGGMFTIENQNGELSPSMRLVKERQLSIPFKVPLTVRIMPTDFNQTSLFHVASNNTARRFFKNEMLGRIGDTVTIYFYGEELRHEDEAIFLQLVHLARGKAPYDWIYVDNVPFIRGARGSVRILSNKDSASIDESLQRMRGAYVMVNNSKRKVFITVNLIRDLQGSGSARRVLIDPCMVALLDSYTAMDQEILYKIKGVSRQLFKYISTKPHVGLYPTKVLSFFELCYGSLESLSKHYRERNPNKTDSEVTLAMSKKVSDFRRKALPAALEELKEMELIVSYDFKQSEDKVAIVKKMTNASVIALEGAETPPS